MKITATPLFLLALIMISCQGNDRQTGGDPQNDIDAARDFIRAALDGNFKKARTYMLQDSLAQERMNAVERLYTEKQPNEEKAGLAKSSINIHNVTTVNDSTTVLIYSNSFKNNKDTLKVVKIQGKWLVDFNYLFDHDSDTLNAFAKPSEPLAQ